MGSTINHEIEPLKIAPRGNFVVVEFLWRTIEVSRFHRKGGAQCHWADHVHKQKFKGRDELIGQSPQTYLVLAVYLTGRRRETTLTAKSNDARARAEAGFRKEQRAKEGAKAMMEYQANARIVREKMERLKALRLAKEAADKEHVD